jgi:hypothetical protein
MKSLSKYLGAMAAMVLLAGTAAAADHVSHGKVKSVNAGKKTFVVTDVSDKDGTYSLADNVVINRNDKESKSDLNVGDNVFICYDKGLVSSTAHYIMVMEGDNKNCELVLGSIKSYDPAKKQLILTDAQNKDWTFVTGDAKVRLNTVDSRADDLKIGEHALAIVDRTGNATILKSLMVNRKK